MIGWCFDKRGGNNLGSGGNQGVLVVKGDLDTLVRESAQNAGDQHAKNSKKPVRMVYTIQELAGTEKKEFLKALKWTQLKEHVVVCKGHSALQKRLEDGLKSMESKSPIRILRIDDFVTQGMTGGEDELDKNFHLLCKSTLRPMNVSGRGGSYGIGKTVFWKLSDVQTVLFSSIPAEGNRKRLRVFGRCDLTTHDIGKDRYDDTGLFGKHLSKGKLDERAESIWDSDAEKLAKKLFLDRDLTRGTGTSILIVNFSEPEEETKRPVGEIAEDIYESAAKWFWPGLAAIGSGWPARLTVKVRAVETGGAITFDKQVDSSDRWAPFIRAVNTSRTEPKVKNAGDVARIDLPFSFPEREVERKHKGFKSVVGLSIRKEDRAYEKHEFANHVAAVRGARMVVMYHKIRTPMDQMPVFGVLQAGTFLKKSGKKEEEFFRSAEPPLHDKWEGGEKTSIKYQYSRGGSYRLRELWADLEKNAYKLIDEGRRTSTSGAEALARLIPIGRSDVRKPPKYGSRHRVISARRKGTYWVVEGKVVCVNFKNKKWNSRINYRIDVESGTSSECMQISKIQSTTPPQYTKFKNLKNGGVEVEVSDKTDYFSYRAKLMFPAHLDAQDRDRIRIRPSG